MALEDTAGCDPQIEIWGYEIRRAEGTKYKGIYNDDFMFLQKIKKTQ